MALMSYWEGVSHGGIFSSVKTEAGSSLRRWWNDNQMKQSGQGSQQLSFIWQGCDVLDNTDTGENNSDVVKMIGDDLESNRPQSAEELLGGRCL